MDSQRRHGAFIPILIAFGHNGQHPAAQGTQHSLYSGAQKHRQLCLMLCVQPWQQLRDDQSVAATPISIGMVWPQRTMAHVTQQHIVRTSVQLNSCQGRFTSGGRCGGPVRRSRAAVPYPLVSFSSKNDEPHQKRCQPRTIHWNCSNWDATRIDDQASGID